MKPNTLKVIPPTSQFSFLEVAPTLVDLLFTELMSHLSHVKQMYCQPKHLAHELILCTQITRGRVHFTRDSTVKGPCQFSLCDRTITNFSLNPGSDLVYTGSPKLCWGFNGTGSAKVVLQSCTTAKLACFRQGWYLFEVITFIISM